MRRELAEELGLVAFAHGAAVWRRHHTFNWGGRRISQKEEYRIVHADRFHPVMTDAAEAKVLDCFRWWPIADLSRDSERLTPPSLAPILHNYPRLGAPPPAPDAGDRGAVPGPPARAPARRPPTPRCWRGAPNRRDGDGVIVTV